ncbi:MAG: YfhO family protein [Anaerolineae bacterium]|nr:YfhO family protein [Anaerolineae bacterium]
MTLRALSRRWPDGLAIIILLLLWLVFFWRLYTPTSADRISISQGDFSGQYYNFSAYQARRFDAGNLFPLWNPYNYAGSPFLADPQASVVYPVRWLFLSLYSGGRWSYAALESEVMAHFLLTSLLMYALVRLITGRPIGGLIAAVAFTYGGYLNSYPIQQVTILESGTWLPLALLGIHQGTESGSRRWGWSIVAGIGLGLIVLAGHPQVAMLCGYLAVAYLAYRVFAPHPLTPSPLRREGEPGGATPLSTPVERGGGGRQTGERSAWVSVRNFILVAAIFGIIGGGLAAVALLPTFEFQQLASRAADLNYASKSGGYPFNDLPQIIWSTMTNLYAPMYIGIIGLALAVIAVVYSRSQALFWIVAGVVALILGFGGKTSLFQFAYTLVPGISIFRDQERAVLLWSICASVLAGIGAARLLEGLAVPDHKRIRYALWGLVAVTVAYWLIIRSGIANIPESVTQVAGYTAIVAGLTAVILPWVACGPRRRQAALVGLLVFDLFSVTQSGPAYSPASPDTVLPPAPWMSDMHERLAADPFARIDGTDKLGVFGPLFALPSMRGSSPLRLAGTERLLALPPAKYWDLLAVRYVVSGEAQLPVPAKRIREVNDWSGQYNVYELDNPRPLATLVYSADVIENDEYAAQIIAAPDFPVRDKVILPKPLSITLNNQRPTDAAVALTNIAPESLKLSAKTSADALLLVSIPYHPGWKAAANGQSLTIVRADLGLMAVPLAAGSYDIVLEFHPASVQTGAVISLIALALTVIGLIGWIVIRRRAIDG